MRLTLFCVSAATLPSTIETIDTKMIRLDHLSYVELNTPVKTRMNAAKAATFVATLMKVVTFVGEPWYTSGDQKWNGAAVTLKAKPTIMRATPTSRRGSLPTLAAVRVFSMSTRLVCPVSP